MKVRPDFLTEYNFSTIGVELSQVLDQSPTQKDNKKTKNKRREKKKEKQENRKSCVRLSTTWGPDYWLEWDEKVLYIDSVVRKMDKNHTITETWKKVKEREEIILISRCLKDNKYSSSAHSATLREVIKKQMSA